MNAFPIAIPANCDGFEDGMTLRDYFAAQIMSAIIVANKPGSGTVREMAERAYIYAEIMIKVRSE
ncbi:hypothetical protein UFOVP714_9 [uncultured Caudovirales phage]|uniref:Uncharacterized protein n=1 Tax=uncultured Caudovirales phage TaxID=2100421 RepID=A0A6J5PCZ9_9CAUD|nr:hypothetical protein UFOVP714_9 [uncultured Caudovirales phage]CAB4167786.1 hypothetical protein UFOVP864_51 [uncultured Caudovirales phage]